MTELGLSSREALLNLYLRKYGVLTLLNSLVWLGLHVLVFRTGVLEGDQSSRASSLEL